MTTILSNNKCQIFDTTLTEMTWTMDILKTNWDLIAPFRQEGNVRVYHNLYVTFHKTG